MTNKEAQQAYADGCPIQYRSAYYGILRYEYINALIYRRKAGKQIVQAELKEYGKNGVTIVNIEGIEKQNQCQESEEICDE